jgi:hypothetical protein
MIFTKSMSRRKVTEKGNLKLPTARAHAEASPYITKRIRQLREFAPGKNYFIIFV